VKTMRQLLLYISQTILIQHRPRNTDPTVLQEPENNEEGVKKTSSSRLPSGH
jgi:hypothetical protein